VLVARSAGIGEYIRHTPAPNKPRLGRRRPLMVAIVIVVRDHYETAKDESVEMTDAPVHAPVR
jgi:hypothetical protein